jgi:hypothetical protein
MPKEVVVIGIVVFCSDPRPEARLREKIKQELISQEDMFAPISILGGPIALAHQNILRTDFNFLMAQFYFALGTFPGISRIIIVGHDCGFYTQIPGGPFTIGQKREDIIKAATFLRKSFPRLTITAFFAQEENNFETL